MPNSANGQQAPHAIPTNDHCSDRNQANLLDAVWDRAVAGRFSVSSASNNSVRSFPTPFFP